MVSQRFFWAMGLAPIGLLACALAIATPAIAKSLKLFKGPVAASVIQVLDGDTFLAEAHLWPGQSLRVNIRIRGIDAPEMKGRCSAEREAALRARDELSRLLKHGTVSISNIGGAKYYGRVLADVGTEEGDAIGAILLERRLVRPYSGGRRRGWCG
ncbi:thermonuclease family protein [Pseudaminobacter sp. NGMCC 1.201702]|uniref:thermonuclease family protein n=1 Tax=Pseudaminobacter sp. NGMCC 1.201702 TaxID=3391825 RepID=UPI0039EF0D3B